MAVKKRPPILQLALLTTLLVVLPIGSYLYIKSGFEHRRTALNELAAYGDASPVLASQNLRSGLVRVVYETPRRATDSVAVSIANLHRAFDNDPSVQFVELSDSTEGFRLEDRNQAVTLQLDESTKAKFTELGDLDQHCANVPVSHRGLVVDTAGMLRRCYDMHDGEQVARLLEHLTMLVPRPVEAEIIYAREQEY